jgi:hypothetical protein
MSKKLLLGAVIPFLSNPIVLAVAGVGAAGYLLYDLFTEKEDTKDNPELSPIEDERLNEPQNTVQTTVNQTVQEPWNDPFPTVGSTVTSTDGETVIKPDNTVDAEAAKKELIRQAMSELGKRSAAKRRKALENNKICISSGHNIV